VCSFGTLMTGKGSGRIVIVRDLCEVSVDLERLCYPFFDFVIEVECDGGPVWLRMTGGEEAKGILRAGLEQDCSASTQP
jgi:hypothetical protein